ncbi:hypothetical protein [Arenibacterium halophilum]|uniref:3-methyladenine DNA glycosylase AlkC n=1 Tax=Arenibacterium halophilum TaxID=2583821 RepID=A0ABY2XE92_9RHOB|nr:hypothetical protein [Arenibacterium halophilum]TMV14788.1 hypothetical protein FGK64_02075 [Arenibacterium halophilum]
MASGYSLKDQLFNADTVGYLAGLFAADPNFDAPEFTAQVLAGFPSRELKQRIDWIAVCLAEQIGVDLPRAAPLLRAALPPPLDPTLKDDDFGRFIFASLGEYVVLAGLDGHPDLALDLIEDITQRFSMEYAVRPFLARYPDLVLARFARWADHPNYHVRRLVSEGSRPRLPWGAGVGLSPEATLPLLDTMHGDDARFVTRSVANHLNDIAKTHPDLVLERLARWRNEGRQDARELRWMVNHALRGLVKAGHPEAMAMLGYAADVALNCTVTVPPRVRIGDVLALECSLTAARKTPVLVDYIVWFARDGGAPRRKVFKLKTGTIMPGTPLVLTKGHRMKGDATTFRLTPGAHAVEIQVNGQVRARAEFTLQP